MKQRSTAEDKKSSSADDVLKGDKDKSPKAPKVTKAAAAEMMKHQKKLK